MKSQANFQLLDLKCQLPALSACHEFCRREAERFLAESVEEVKSELANDKTESCKNNNCDPDFFEVGTFE
ncbi:hypothetical protein A3C33_02755 [Candidatus Curtissbacteria bacterium RIFCSPHIGHO2_02_FULL_42_58]|nr:MAG: hypothetical protein A3C33_02755 [Candidatus Curtissbacteria bacterium RIFCSPHIGHO2_02_FULL_42_58]OGD97724.1 MAG: hypothetical protein A3E71_03265 [Candidatus Curtissbacteria bacterium RIFCSPHIGHO2_12_FULL_42_33]OGE02042.1 MAG: hypothetical protein A3G16_00120 [Candidatus Curtissbacteria bacterium RIFCSPLOWO2_12_FULL_41_16]